MSRKPTAVDRREAHTILKDLGSTNGTYVNGSRLAPFEGRRDQRSIVKWALGETNNHVPAAAQLLDLDQSYVRGLVKTLGLESPL